MKQVKVQSSDNVTDHPQPWILQIPDPGILHLGDDNDGVDDKKDPQTHNGRPK